VAIAAVVVSCASLAVAWMARRDSRRAALATERQEAREARVDHKADGPTFVFVEGRLSATGVARFVFRVTGGPARLQIDIEVAASFPVTLCRQSGPGVPPVSSMRSQPGGLITNVRRGETFAICAYTPFLDCIDTVDGAPRPMPFIVRAIDRTHPERRWAGFMDGQLSPS